MCKTIIVFAGIRRKKRIDNKAKIEEPLKNKLRQQVVLGSSKKCLSDETCESLPVGEWLFWAGRANSKNSFFLMTDLISPCYNIKMSYASIGIIAIIIQIVINFDVLKISSRQTGIAVHGAYRRYLFSVMAYNLVDFSWGIFYDLKISLLTYLVTLAYFVSMAVSVFLWTRYVIVYINRKNTFKSALNYLGWFFLLFQIIVLIVNLFIPVAFWVEKNGDYHTSYARYINLGIQIFMFFVTAIHMFLVVSRSQGSERNRHMIVGFSSLTMMIFVLGQAKHIYMPLYSVGCMISICVLHTFVLENEKEEHNREIQEMRERELAQEKALGSARLMAYTDPLTGVKNKYAYIEAEKLIDTQIKNGSLKEFGIIVFDLNGLKFINDTRGHEAGDQYIKSASSLICSQFKHSPVYRIGGDEFVALLEGEDFNNHKALLDDFENRVEKNQLDGLVVVSSGFDSFNSDSHDTFLSVFERADKKMYERKTKLKAMKG